MENILICVFMFFLCHSYSYSFAKHGNCHPTENCQCYDNLQYTEYQCGFEEATIKLQVHPRENKVVMECEDLVYDLDIFPNVDAENATFLDIHRCMHPNFTAVSRKLNVTNSVTHLRLIGLVCSTDVCHNVSLRKDFFKDLNNVIFILVRDVSLILEDDFLTNTPKLKTLKLPSNDIKEIGYMFNNTPQLISIDLSSNKLRSLPHKVFSSLSKLENLGLSQNCLTQLDDDIFEGVSQLIRLDLSFNKFNTLPKALFANLTNLKRLNLKSNNISLLNHGLFRHNVELMEVILSNNLFLTLTDDLFIDKPKLEIVNLNICNLKKLPEHIFEGSTNLKIITLTNNNLKTVPQDVFKGLEKLEELNISYNEIDSITENLFKDLLNLKKLNLKHNQISKIESYAFSNLLKLVEINLAENKLNSFVLNSELDACESLEIIDLSSNYYNTFPQNVVLRKNHLTQVNLQANSIGIVRISDFIGVNPMAINLSKNNLTFIDFKDALELMSKTDETKYDARHNQLPSIKIDLSDNTIECDCYLYNLSLFNHDQLNPILQTMFSITQKSLRCSNLNQILVSDLNPSYLSCPINYSRGCPGECFCLWKPHKKSVFLDCSNRNLEIAPEIRMREFRDISTILRDFAFNQTIVDLGRNNLTEGPSLRSGYDNVTTLVLSNNQLSSLQWIPPRIEVLHLDHNNFEKLEGSVISILENTTTLQNLTLFENPWACDCSAEGLQKFLKKFYKMVSGNDVICAGTQEALVDIKNICPFPTIMIVAITIILVFVCILVTMLAIYYRYEKGIRAYLFAKKICLWFIREEDLDQDKIYDVFLCYSHVDEAFVIKEILAELESGPEPYRVCVHVRDFTPGEFIATQVMQSVRDSKRTLIVLSNNFLESVWFQVEFRYAHAQMMNDGLARLVMIIYGDLNEDLLDDELKTYLKTNTYVKWGERYFWQQLKYALPHSRCGFDDKYVQVKSNNSPRMWQSLINELDIEKEMVEPSESTIINVTGSLNSWHNKVNKNVLRWKTLTL